ncbi:24834_t:CDS:1, partial [Dentiscutata erythropus]
LAFGTLVTLGLGVFIAKRRVDAKKPDFLTASPPIVSSDAEEEAFIKEFLKAAEEEDVKKKH